MKDLLELLPGGRAMKHGHTLYGMKLFVLVIIACCIFLPFGIFCYIACAKDEGPDEETSN